jgi:hypothetical protein
MSTRGRGLPNPFFAILLIASIAFVVTTLAYLMGPTLQQRILVDPSSISAGRRAFAAWFDRNGVSALSVEFGIMSVSAVLAIATDRWFSAKQPARDPTKNV